MRKHHNKANTRRAAQSRRVALVCAVLTGILLTGFFVTRELMAPSRTPLPARAGATVSHVGTLRLEPDRQGRCAEYQFNNDTGNLIPSGSVDCLHDPLLDQPAGAAPEGNRLGSIRDGFRNR